MATLFERVRKIVTEKLNVEDEVEINTNTLLYEDLGADSSDLADLEFTLEKQFGIEIKEYIDFKTIGEVVNFLKSQGVAEE